MIIYFLIILLIILVLYCYLKMNKNIENFNTDKRLSLMNKFNDDISSLKKMIEK